MEKQLEEYLHQHIPLSQSMGIRVEHASTHKVILFAPLANNINHKKTVFGGSLHAVATLACWSLLYLNLEEKSDEKFQIVITKSEVSYDAPVDTDFRVECLTPENITWERFMKMLTSKGKARIKLSAYIYHKDRLSVNYQAEFAALRSCLGQDSN